MPMFKSSRSTAISGNSSGGYGLNVPEMKNLHKTKKLQRSLSNSTPASLGDQERYIGIETQREEQEEIRQSPPPTKIVGYAGRANAAAAQTKQYVYPKEAPANASNVRSPIAMTSRSNSNVSSSSATSSVLRKKRVITPQMVKRRSINIKNLPLVMKSDESHTSASKNSVLTEQTEKASNRKESKRRQNGFVIGIKKLDTIESRGTLDSARKKSLPPLSPGLKSKAMTTGRSVESAMDKAKIADKENTSIASNSVKGKEGASGASEGETHETIEKIDSKKECAIPLTKRVPSGQSCSAFFLSDASSSAMSDPTKDYRNGARKVSPVKRAPMVRDKGIRLEEKDAIVSKVNTASKDGRNVNLKLKDEKSCMGHNALKESYSLSKEGSTLSKESLESLAEYALPLKKDTHTYEKKNITMSPLSRNKTSVNGSAASGLVTPSSANAKRHHTESLSIDTKLANQDMSGPVSPLLSPRKKEEFEVELPAARAGTQAPIAKDENGEKVAAFLKHVRSPMPKKEGVEETSKDEENIESANNEGKIPDEKSDTEETQKVALSDNTNEEGPNDLKANQSSDQIVDIGVGGSVPTEKARSNYEENVTKVKQPAESKAGITLSSRDGNEPVDKHEGIRGSSSRSQGSNEDNCKEICAPSGSTSGKLKTLGKTPHDSPPSLNIHNKMDEIGKIDVAPIEEPSGRTKKNESRGRKKKQMIMTSFLGKKSKVIKEDAEYVAGVEEEANNDMCQEEKASENERMAINMDDYQDQASDEILDIHLQATLSDCEFSSVQSSVTTDKAFETQPSLIKRTSSFIRNPLLRRNRSKKTEMEELLQCMKNGKLAARMDNKRVEEFDDSPTGDEKHPNCERTSRDEEKQKLSHAQGKNKRLAVKRGGKRKGDSDDESPCTEEQESSEEANSDEVHYDYSEVDESDDDPTDERIISAKTVSFAGSADDSSDTPCLTSKSTFDNNLTRPSVTLPDVDDSAKVEVRSPSFRLSAVSGSGAPRVPSPLAQQIMLHALTEGTQTENALNEGTQTESLNFPLIRNVSAGSIRGVASHGNHGTQTSDDPVRATTFTFADTIESQPNAAFYPLTQNGSSGSRGMCSVGHGAQTSSNSPTAPATSFGTFGDVIESIGLFSARLCLGTGAAIASCSRACNDKPYVDSTNTILASSSFVEPEVHLSPRNAAFSPQNTIFRAAQHHAPVSDGYTQVLAEAISQMPEEEQLDLVRQLSNKSLKATSKSFDDFDDMASSVDGMFRQRGLSRRKKRVPRNIAVKPKPKRTIEVPIIEQQNLNQQPELRRVSSTGKKPFGGIKKGFKRLTKTRLAVMYQV
ncbi:hypothetical protein HJC23_001397 [Cyclotella cryptica]|uniref:Uncharacterized protein n=1 Tax=Cyclotella cryptica TaxID=29204 RepID=A0ABD3P847_9STRA|eukprot:CCRYP_016717-RA/>CCRYP_016717-RA protein AED:0.11 eAED:0.11 QI:150/-1/1/1/-1/1/1/1645/1321